MSKFQVFLIVLYLFFFGGVGGWVLELLFRRFFSGANPERKWLNPGFLFGPCLPLYGFGTVLLFILSELDHTLFGSFSGTFWYYPVMFVVMALAMTLLEYIVGLVSFKGFHLRLWDYSKLWGNIQGIICPLFTFFWGVLSLGYYFMLYPRLRKLVEWFVAHPLASFMVGVCFGIFLIDLCFSVHLGAVVQKKAAQIDKTVYDAIDVQKLWHKMQSRGGFFRFVSTFPAAAFYHDVKKLKKGLHFPFGIWYTGICKKLRLSGKEGGSLCFQSGNILFMALRACAGSRKPGS